MGKVLFSLKRFALDLRRSLKVKPKRRLLLHVGMHKTGTSSIQEVFSQSNDPQLEYVNWINSNHSSLFILLFEDEGKLGQYHGFRNRGEKCIADLPDLRATWMEQLTNQINGADGKTVIFSAEDCSAPAYASALERLHLFFAQAGSDIGVIGYARAPESFMQAAFQQNLRGGVVIDMGRKGPRPNYRERFEKIDRIFGRDQVLLKEYNRNAFPGGDVVKDFADSIGVSRPHKRDIITINESLSLEATALLYVQRTRGRGFVSGFAEAELANNAFVAALSRIGHRRFSFSDGLLSPLVEGMADDVRWMEERLGHPFSETPRHSAKPISAMEEFDQIALQSYETLIREADLPHAGEATMENLVDALEHLRDVKYREAIGRAHGGSSLN